MQLGAKSNLIINVLKWLSIKLANKVPSYIDMEVITSKL